MAVSRSVKVIRCACMAAIVSAVALLPATAVHEAAHMAVCLIENPDADWTLDIGIDGARGSCPGIQNLPAYYASGGLVAAAAAAIAAFVPSVRRRPFLHGAALAIFVWQLSTAVVETLAHTWYITSDGWHWAAPVAFVVVPSILCARRLCVADQTH